MRLTSFCFVGVAAAAFALTGCPAPPPRPGPPPTPTPTVATQQDDSDMPPAPVLPDPRPDLPPVDTAAALPQRGPAPADEAANFGPDDEPAGDLEVNLYSVQVFSSSTQAGAENVAGRVRNVVSEPVEVVQEADGKWRVYLGRSPGREPIDRLRDRLSAGQFTGCWTKRRLVRTATADVSLSAGQSVYSVQVFVSSAQDNANRIAGEVRSKTRMDVQVVRMGPVWKVFVGQSRTRAPIDAERDRLRGLGYPDAWTYLREGTQGP